MDRRKFLCRVTNAVTAAGAVPAIAAGSAPREGRSVTCQVKGFTCITCAVGLEVMLRGLRGVTWASASYPANSVSIGFDPRVIAEEKIVEFIGICGFSVARRAPGN
jgi:Cu+-exporting ATPase